MREFIAEALSELGYYAARLAVWADRSANRIHSPLRNHKREAR